VPQIYDTQEPKTRQQLAEEAENPPADGSAVASEDLDEQSNKSSAASQPTERVVDMIPLGRGGRGPYVVMTDHDLRRSVTLNPL
jgi:hypothetical protein